MAEPVALLLALLVSAPVRACQMPPYRVVVLQALCSPLQTLTSSVCFSAFSVLLVFEHFKIIVLFSLLNASSLLDRNTLGGYSSALIRSL